MTYDFDTIVCTLSDDGVLDIVLNRPEQRNAVSHLMDAELVAALDRAEEDDAVGAVMLTGAGVMFSSGHDLKEQTSGRVFAETLYPLASPSVAPVLPRAWYFRKPLIAGVHGFVGPYALAILSWCDWVIAAEGTRFSFEISRSSAPQLPFVPLYELLPIRVLKKLFLFGGWMDADQAHDLHLVQRVVPEAELRDVTARWASQAALIPSESFGHAKETMHRTYELMGMQLTPTVMKRWGPPPSPASKRFAENVVARGLRDAVRERDAKFDPEITRI
ncbi:enoyl-CoA hydratase/isomerase family protein [Microbacterium sp. X-17]|uniref:enoyl-CoA hydratase/isomerase family protein n=1 Tax=Microbacterium sp. X-17 TaxID=3144404 RepID=UPI0031F4A0ED